MGRHTLVLSIAAEVSSMCSFAGFITKRRNYNVQPICMVLSVGYLHTNIPVMYSIAKLCIVKNVHELVQVACDPISLIITFNAIHSRVPRNRRQVHPIEVGQGMHQHRR